MQEDADKTIIDSGYRQIGSLDYGMKIKLWWHEELHLQLMTIRVIDQILIKGSKSYYLRSMDPESQTWVRDIPGFHDYLLSHFPEIHISASSFRDITSTAIQKHLKAIADHPDSLGTFPDLSKIRVLQEQLEQNVNQYQRLKLARGSLGNNNDDLGSYLKQKEINQKQQIKIEKQNIGQKKKQYKLFENLQREYLNKGSALSLKFSIQSNMFITSSKSSELKDIVSKITKELIDYDKYQITQKLNGSKLKVFVAPTTEPLTSLIDIFMAGTLSPNELDDLTEPFQQLNNNSLEQMVVTADEDIVVDQRIKQTAKKPGAWIISDLLQRLDSTGGDPANVPVEIVKGNMQITLGRYSNTSGELGKIAIIPLDKLGHIYLSGKTGSGKSYSARAIIEEAMQYKELSVLILDPRNQSFGLKIAEDDKDILNRYSKFGMKTADAKGFDINYFAPGLNIKAPANLKKLSAGHNIVSFKGLEDEERCELFHNILLAVFTKLSNEQSSKPRLLIVIEEAHRFTRQKLSGDKQVDEAARKAEKALDLLMREGRKYGIMVMIISQTLGDFVRSSRTIRQNTTTRFLMANSDREIEYAAEFMDNPKSIALLPQGTGVLHHPGWPIMQIAFRPPRSKVWEFSPEQIISIMAPSEFNKSLIDADAIRLLEVVTEAHNNGEQPLNVTVAAERAGLTSKRKVQDIISVLVGSGYVQTRQLQQRGNPRVIVLNAEMISSGPDEIVD